MWSSVNNKHIDNVKANEKLLLSLTNAY